MAKLTRDTGLNLIQNNASRELMLEKMRGKLAATPGTAVIESARKREVRRKATATWTVRGLVLLALCAVNYLIIGNREVIAAKLHKPAVARLPLPAENLSTDDQALYYVYALYDYAKLKERYGVNGFFAIDQADAKRRLEAMLPQVSPRTLGTISAYMPVAFKTAVGEASP